MKPLTRKEDPTGFLNLFRMAASDRFGNPAGVIEGRGRWGHHTKAGPGRFGTSGQQQNGNGSKGLRGSLGLRRGH
jgi:hypothetical protein